MLDIDIPEQIRWKESRMLRGLEHVTALTRLRAGFGQPGDKVTNSVLLSSFTQWVFQEDGARSFSEMQSKRMRSNRPKLQEGKF